MDPVEHQSWHSLPAVIWMRWFGGVVVAIILSVFIVQVLWHDNQLKGCLIGSEDRITSAYTWRSAEQARLEDWKADRDPADLATARNYAAAASGYEERAGVTGPVDIRPDADARDGKAILAREIENTFPEREARCLERWPEFPLVQ